MRTLQRRIEKLEREGNTSGGPLLRLYVMPAGFQLSQDLAKADEASRYGGSARGYSLVVLAPGSAELSPRSLSSSQLAESALPPTNGNRYCLITPELDHPDA